MIDPNLIRYNINQTAKKLAYRKFYLNIEQIHEQEINRKILQIKTEKLQSKKKKLSKIIGIAKNKGENIQELCNLVKKIKINIDNAKIKLSKLKTQIYNYMLSIPNITALDVPIGNDKNDNVEIFRWGKKKTYNFKILDHVEIGKFSKGLDFKSAVKITGSRFVVMQGQIALLYRALTQFMLDLHIEHHGYREYYLPYLVNQKSLYGTGHLKKFTDDLFYIKNYSENNNYCLIPTAEVPLTNLIRDKILKEKNLPIKMIANTPCFRFEAGSYGQATKGLIRMHQFDKIELVQIVKPENSMKTLEEITFHAEKVLQLLKLPYRKILLCTGDIGFASCKTYDLEVWLPTQKSYLEISSCSNMSDFQARRINSKFRNKKNNNLHLVHTLNGSALAIGRTLIAVLENYQLSNRTIKIPLILKPYMKGLTHIKIN